MFKIFRNNRKTLFSKGNSPKYLTYALGEILLVVIGILIALQVNTWNENRKLNFQKSNLLNEFTENLEIDRMVIEKIININAPAKTSAQFILEYMEKDLPYHDSLKYHFGNTVRVWPFIIKLGAYQNYRSSNLNMIISKELRQGLNNYYEARRFYSNRNFELYNEMIENASQNVLNTRFVSFWDSNYEDWKMTNDFVLYQDGGIVEMIPIDFESLKNDQEYRYFLRTLINKYNWWIEMTAITNANQIEDLLMTIEMEMERKI